MIGNYMNKQLLFSVTKKDFIVEPYKGSGKGGQHRNKTMSCVKIKHLESGAEAIGTEHREQSKNKKLAFKRIIETKEFKTWLKLKTSRVNTIKDVELKPIDPKDLIIEYL
jgi:peptide chain release factor 1